MKAQLTVVSWGAGVQSTTLLAMSALGDLPKIDLAIHADTTWERQATYQFVDRFVPWLEAHGIPLVAASSLSARNPKRDGTNIHVPAFMINRYGKVGKLNRQCTGRWKTDLVRKLTRQELAQRGLKPVPGIVEQWLGISWDEASRAKNSIYKYIDIRHPFLEKETRMTRADCIKYLQQHGLEVPVKSSCTHCVFHSQTMWEAMKRENGPDWKQAVEFDLDIRNKSRSEKSKVITQHFIHKSARPLTEAIKLAEEEGYEPQSDLIPGPGCDSAGYCWD